MSGESAVRVAWLYPDLLGTYGDRGNAAVLEHRARARGHEVELHEVRELAPVPADADIYLLGGGEDWAQEVATARLREDRGLATAVSAGKVVFGVCAGYQILGHAYADVSGRQVAGLDLLDVTSARAQPRSVGELLAEPDDGLGLPLLTGFENHAGISTVGPDATPLGRVLRGRGNGDGSGTEGALAGRIVGTYLHGPALVRNPVLADLLLSWVVGAVEPLDDDWIDELRRERIDAAMGNPISTTLRRWRGRR